MWESGTLDILNSLEVPPLEQETQCIFQERLHEAKTMGTGTATCELLISSRPSFPHAIRVFRLRQFSSGKSVKTQTEQRIAYASSRRLDEECFEKFE